MGKTVLMQGNEACVEGALAAGMRPDTQSHRQLKLQSSLR